MLRRLCVVSVLATCLLIPALAGANYFIKKNVPLQLEQLRNSNFAIMLITILKVDKQGATYGNPPAGLMRIDKVIRGRGIPTGEMRFILSPPVKESDKMHDGGIRPEWYLRKLPPPPEGESFIAFTYRRGKILAGEVKRKEAIKLEYPLVIPTAHNVATVEGRIATNDREMWQQTTLAGICITASIVSLLLHIPAVRKSTPERPHKLLVVMFATLAFVTFALYELGVSPYMAIRFDLLVLVPAITTCILSLAWSLFAKYP